MSTRVLRVCLLMVLTAVMLSLAAAPVFASNGRVAPKVRLGAFLAGDRSLSDPDGQACADCHFPRAGYADPDQDLPVSQGVLPGLFGGRNAPTWAYTAWSPRAPLRRDRRGLDRRHVLGRPGRRVGALPLAEQARGPFLNPVEMQNPSKAEAIREVRTHRTPPSSASSSAGTALRRRSGLRQRGPRDRRLRVVPLVNTFSSRFDAYMAGNAAP